MSPQTFHPIETPLYYGVNLLEASAGTGKTYTIAMLVLRFIVERNLKIDQLLVVTFTKAATEELKDRIRSRLSEAKHLVSGKQINADATILNWLAQLKIEPHIIQQRLESALLNIDQAGIFTIHGFCQRMLTEHALESGQLFNLELTTEIHEIQQACADDFWRCEIYSRPAHEVALLTSEYKTPDALLNSIRSISFATAVVPEYRELNQLLSDFLPIFQQAQQQFVGHVETLSCCFNEDKFKESFCSDFVKNLAQLNAWFQQETLLVPDKNSLGLLTPAAIKQGLNSNKFRATKQQTADERKQAYLTEQNLEQPIFEKLVAAMATITLSFRRALWENLVTSIEKRLQELQVLSFEQLISRLYSALVTDKQRLLTSALQQRFHAALIDEFQDTDPEQWGIFSQLFATSTHYLYLIGDPKQAIYKFRGADIFAYFAAQQQATYHFTLDYNWRSHPQLVESVNLLFQRERAFLFEMLQFYPVKPGRTIKDGELHYQNQVVAPLMLWQLDNSSTESGYWTAGKAAIEIQTAVVNEVVNLLNNNFNLRGKRVEPQNIAILVRTNAQAHEYQAALQTVKVPAVLNSQASVYASVQAVELYKILQAVAEPSDGQLLHQALSVDWFGLNGQQFYQLIHDESQLDNWVSRFQSYQQRWQTHGLMAMMQRLLIEEKVLQQLARSPQAERALTNVYHLLELLQQTADEQHLGSHKLLNYLANAINELEITAEEQQLRLESDADAVKIVTIHRSKGLEYDIVFCPVLWQNNDRILRETQVIQCHQNGVMLTDLGSEDFENNKLQAFAAQQAEDLRLFYVALTRAKYRCYLVWANVRSEKNANQSALAYLLDFAEEDFATQQQKLVNFSVEQPDIFAYQLLTLPNESKTFYNKTVIPPQFNAQQITRHWYSDWQMSSYTALATLSKATELPLDKAQELEEKRNTDVEVLLLPKGSHTGNVIHNLLEFNPFHKLAEFDYDISLQRDKTCLRFGLKLAQPQVINELLRAVVATPLSTTDESFCLKNLKPWDCVKEMPFYLTMHSLQIKQLNHLLSDCVTFQPLTEKKMSGFLTGFIDLICQYQGKYYVMDYKTNYLVDYQPHTLQAAMREHNYGLQYWLYSVVLHLYLQIRLPNYNYQQHFGGVRYLFVRGMQAEIAMSGVYADLPEFTKLTELAKLIEQN